MVLEILHLCSRNSKFLDFHSSASNAGAQFQGLGFNLSCRSVELLCYIYRVPTSIYRERLITKKTIFLNQSKPEVSDTFLCGYSIQMNISLKPYKTLAGQESTNCQRSYQRRTSFVIRVLLQALCCKIKSPPSRLTTFSLQCCFH